MDSKKSKNRAVIDVKGSTISILKVGNEDYISLTDMTKNFDGQNALIENWLRSKDTILFLGAWEKIYNTDFNSLEFDGIKNDAGRNSFYLSVKKWIELTNAKGVISSAGRYGGTFAHKDIAFEFGTWLSPEFKLYLIKDFQRLKDEENQRKSLDWNLNRVLAKLNYRIHTDAIKEILIPEAINKRQEAITYANEADVLNVALFGMTAKEWRDKNPGVAGNLRDYATIGQLLIMANLESMNAEFIRRGLSQTQRLKELNSIAIIQAKSLMDNKALKQLEGKVDSAEVGGSKNE